MPAINGLVGAGYMDAVNTGPGTPTAAGGSPASNYLPGHSDGSKIHMSLAVILAGAIATLVLFQIGGFRAMVAVGRSR